MIPTELSTTSVNEDVTFMIKLNNNSDESDLYENYSTTYIPSSVSMSSVTVPITSSDMFNISTLPFSPNIFNKFSLENSVFLYAILLLTFIYNGEINTSVNAVSVATVKINNFGGNEETVTGEMSCDLYESLHYY